MKRGWTYAILIAAAAAGAALSKPVWDAYRKQSRERDSDVRRMSKAEADLESVREQDSKMHSPAGQEEHLRRQDKEMRLPGEVDLK